MLKKFKAFGPVSLLLLGILSLGVGCGASKEVKVDASQDGGQVDLAKGQVLVVTLESNPTTGYRWEAVELDVEVLRQVGDAEFKPQSDLIGAPGVEITRFQAVEAGQAMLRMVYHRPWETDVEPLETFSVGVTVK
jgi:inhibitor of cysteine peptidase